MADAASDTPDADYRLPEVTRALRAFGARRGRPGSDHDRFYAPLLDALRAARDHVARGTDRPWEAAGAVDARAVSGEVRAALADLAARHAGPRAPDRRALEAELEELAAPLLAALDALGAAAADLAAADAAGRPAAWRAWSAALGRAFAAADGAWEATLPVLADPRGGVGRLWRRVLRGPAGPGGGRMRGR